MIEFLDKIDKSLFVFLNGINSPFFDPVMYHISNIWTWLPVFVILLYVTIKKYGIKTLWIFLFIAILVTLTDQSSVHLFKNVCTRLRPCHEPSLNGLVHTVYNKCGGQYGFVSSHAANYSGIAAFFIILLSIKQKSYIILLILWVTLICYSRIYLGVHYPADVIAGSLLGTIIGWIWAKITLKLLLKLPPVKSKK